MKTPSNLTLGLTKWLLCFFVLSAPALFSQEAPEAQLYEAEGRACSTCHGSGKETCFNCKGEDLTKKPCWSCKGVDLTQTIYWNCKGVDLTRTACWSCKGDDLTQKPCWRCRGSGRSGDSRCFYCSGSGRNSHCFYCGGTGKNLRCLYCNASGRNPHCVYCSGSGKQARCFYCDGRAATGKPCETCVGLGVVEVLVAKHISLEEMRKSLTAKRSVLSREAANGTMSSLVAEDGSRYGEVSKETGRPKTVFVHGYWRKDGTYVQSHYRCLPSQQWLGRDNSSKLAPPIAENGSYYGQPNQYGVPKTVHVGGYFRKDGTYVRGHYRSAPRR